MTSLAELMNLKGRRAVITGATGKIGTIIADSLAELGAELVLVDRPGADFAAVATLVADRWGAVAHGMPCDLEQQEDRDRLVAGLAGRADILVNNAAFVGTSQLRGWAEPFQDQSVDTWRRALEVNLTAVLAASSGGSIVNIASIYAHLGPDWSLYEGTRMANPAAYAASKGGLLQLTRWMATTLAPQIRVNSLSPGGVSRGQPEVFAERYKARTPLKRMATEDDFRGAIAYLASDLSRYVTGQDLTVDGGWSAW